MKTALLLYGLCPLSIPGNIEMSIELCRMEADSERRVIIPDKPLPWSEGFEAEIEAVCWPKHKC